MNDHPSILVSEYHEHVQGEEDINDYEEDGSAGCFGVFRFPWKQSSSDNERKYLLGGCNTKTKVTWWRMKLNKTREFTEVLGGPKWKNLVSKIGAYCRRCRKQRIRLCKKNKPKNRFHYDVHSHALNFDNGTDGRDGVVDFSARFAVPSNLQSSTATLVVKPPMSASIGSPKLD